MEPVSSCFGWIFSSKLGCIVMYCKVKTDHIMQDLLELKMGQGCVLSAHGSCQMPVYACFSDLVENTAA